MYNPPDVLHEYPDAVWHQDRDGLSPLALLVMSKPRVETTSDLAASGGMAPKREAGGEQIQRWGRKEAKLGDGIQGMLRGGSLRPDGGPLAEDGRELEEERREVALHQVMARALPYG